MGWKVFVELQYSELQCSKPYYGFQHAIVIVIVYQCLKHLSLESDAAGHFLLELLCVGCLAAFSESLAMTNLFHVSATNGK